MALPPKLEVGQVLLYFNNQQQPIPCLIHKVQGEAEVAVNVLFETGVAYRSNVPFWPLEPNQYQFPGGEFVCLREQDKHRDRQYPLSPDLW